MGVESKRVRQVLHARTPKRNVRPPEGGARGILGSEPRVQRERKGSHSSLPPEFTHLGASNGSPCAPPGMLFLCWLIAFAIYAGAVLFLVHPSIFSTAATTTATTTTTTTTTTTPRRNTPNAEFCISQSESMDERAEQKIFHADTTNTHSSAHVLDRAFRLRYAHFCISAYAAGYTICIVLARDWRLAVCHTLASFIGLH